MLRHHTPPPPSTPSSSDPPPSLKQPASETDERNFHANWEKRKESFWYEFHRDWWGSAGRIRLHDAAHKGDRVVLVDQMPVWDLFSDLRRSNGHIYVRREYEEMCARLQQARKSHRAISGIVVHGEPGIGKSFFIIYALLQCMSKEQSVLFTSKPESDSDPYLIDECGVWTKSLAALKPSKDLPMGDHDRRPSTRVWSLIDTDPETEPISIALTHPTMFFVLAASLEGKSRLLHNLLDAWWASGSAQEWVMPPWEDEELYALISTPNVMPLTKTLPSSEFKTLEVVKALRMQAGPSPSDLLIFMHDEHRFKHDIARTIDEHVERCLQHAHARPFPPMITVHERVGPVVWYRSDHYVARFKTDSMSVQLLDKFLASSGYVASFIYAYPRHMGPSMMSHAFKAVAICSTSGSRGRERELIRLQPMAEFPSSGSCADGSRRFLYWHGTPETTLTVNTDRRTELRSELLNEAYTHSSSSISERHVLPVTDREIVRYDDVNNITANAGHYYVAKGFSNTCFDAFFYEVKDTKVVVWVLVLPVKHVAGDANADSMTIERLRMRAREAWPTHCVEVKYVLLVPIVSVIMWAVEWKMNRELCGGAQVGYGDVFVQFLKMNKLYLEGKISQLDDTDRMDAISRCIVEDAM